MPPSVRARVAYGVALLSLAAASCRGGLADDVGAPSPRASATHSPPAAAAVGPSPVAPSAQPCGDDSADRLVTWRVEVDRALRSETTPARFAGAVRSVLCDRRSWIASAAVRFRYSSNGRLLIGLRTPGNTERRCRELIGLSVNHYYSCGTPREVALNADRWFGNSRSFPGTLTEYRQMLLNHEVGHALAQHHRQCPRDGAAAPVMMQQSKGMTTPNGRTCEHNPWPLRYELEALAD